MPDANYGYGYPFYNYYAPLSIYIASAFRLLGFDFIWSIQLSQLLGFLVAAWGMFLLARRWLRSDWAALLAAAAYTLAPFHMVNVYVRGDSLAEFWAMAFFPLVLLAVDRLFQATTETNPSGQEVARYRPKRGNGSFSPILHCADPLSQYLSPNLHAVRDTLPARRPLAIWGRRPETKRIENPGFGN